MAEGKRRKMIKGFSRIMPEEEVEEWLEGERIMEEDLGIGFKKTQITKEGDFYIFWYDEKEIEDFSKWLDENFDEKLFDIVADNFMERWKNKESLKNLVTGYTIFNLFEECPEYIEEMPNAFRRLARIRKYTEDFENWR